MAGRAIDLANRMIPQRSRLSLPRTHFVCARMDQAIQQLERPLMLAITACLVYLLPNGRRATGKANHPAGLVFRGQGIQRSRIAVKPAHSADKIGAYGKCNAPVIFAKIRLFC